MRKSKNEFKRLHKWPGLIIAIFLIYFSFSGILMNHRNLISGIDIPRKLLPETYQYRNWNLAALKGNISIGKDSMLVYGNIGIWLTDSTFSNYKSFNQGLPKGTDNHKIYDIHVTPKGFIYAGTLNGLYSYSRKLKTWKKIDIQCASEQFVGIQSKNDSIFAINRSNIFKGEDNGILTTFCKFEIPAPGNYKNKVSLFQTLWQIHSGEIFGIAGKLFVDFLGIVTIFISITGIIFFFFPSWIKKRKKKGRESKRFININKWSLNWHNKTGNWLIFFLIILYFSGMFLRPPLLIPIANTEVSPMKLTHLDQANPWYDKLRDLLYDKERDIFILGTSDGLFHTNFCNDQPQKFIYQPPISVMGITVLEPYKEGTFLIGSFSGLFLWHPSNPKIIDFAKGKVYKEFDSGRPVGQYATSGIIRNNNGKLYMVDYNIGIQPLWHSEKVPKMTENMISNSKMSLWNFALELHTGRIFKNILSDFYILIVPLVGLISLLVLISGFIIYKKRKKMKSR